MADRQGLQKRLLASVVLLGLGVCFFGVAAFLYVKGLQWANEFSGVASLFVALAALFSPLARQMLRWLLRPGESADLSPGQAAEDLAAALEIQWTRQEDLRKINHPSPLPVRWQVTSLARAAMQGVNWPDLGKPGRAVTPSALADSFEKAGELLYRLPWQRLVILGRGGSGKTMVAIRLARSLLAERASGGAVPVLLTVATWQPHQQTLLSFAASQLIRDHPGLNSLVKAGDGQQVTMAHALLTTRKLLLILDGADEIPEPLRPEAVRQISAVPVNTPLVVTSRTTEYVQAVQEAGRGLPRAAVVEMLPLSLSYIPKYLTEATAPPDNRWQPVFKHLAQHKHGQLAEALQTPLMIWLTRTVYAETNTSPADLIPLALDGARDAIEKHLMSKLVPAVYTPGDYSPAVATRWKPEPAEAWLRFVAHHLQAEQTPNFAWWDLNRRAPRSVLGIIGGLPIGAPIALVIGLTVGITKGPLTGLIDGAITGAVVSALAGLPGGLSSWRQMRPSRVEVRIRGNLGRLVGRLALGLLFGFGFGAVVGLPVVFLYGLQAGVLVALALGPAIGFALTLRQLFDASSDIRTAVSPASVLHDDTMSAIVQTSMGALALSLGAGIAIYATISFGAATGIAIGIAYGLAYGITFGIGYRTAGLTTPAFMPFIIARTWLAIQRNLPWALMEFLEDAHQLGVLRQQGAVYQFRHAVLQAHLASAESRPVLPGTTTP